MYEKTMNKPNTVKELIANWKRIGHFAEAIGCNYEAARQMRLRGKIAPDHWVNVVNAAKAQGVEGVTFEWLAAQRKTAS